MQKFSYNLADHKYIEERGGEGKQKRSKRLAALLLYFIGTPPLLYFLCSRYWSTLLEANLWPRFDHIMHLHIESVKNADPERFAANLDTPPHYVKIF